MMYIRAAWHLGVTVVIVSVVAGRLHASDTSREADDIMGSAMFTPKPEYPYAARYYYVQGSGTYLVRLHTPTGQVKQVTVVQSTGSRILDAAAIAGLKRWRFKPGAVAPMSRHSPGFKDRFAAEDRLFKVPVHYVMNRHRRGGTYVVRQPL